MPPVGKNDDAAPAPMMPPSGIRRRRREKKWPMTPGRSEPGEANLEEKPEGEERQSR
jgi:hypothetical protein